VKGGNCKGDRGSGTDCDVRFDSRSRVLCFLLRRAVPASLMASAGAAGRAHAWTFHVRSGRSRHAWRGGSRMRRLHSRRRRCRGPRLSRRSGMLNVRTLRSRIVALRIHLRLSAVRLRRLRHGSVGRRSCRCSRQSRCCRDTVIATAVAITIFVVALAHHADRATRNWIASRAQMIAITRRGDDHIVSAVAGKPLGRNCRLS
jgi:hypothetical protein